MNLKGVFCVGLSVLMLSGCGSSTSSSATAASKMYKGLDAKETIQKAVSFFQKDVKYLKSSYKSVNGDGTKLYQKSEAELFNIDNKRSLVSKILYFSGKDNVNPKGLDYILYGNEDRYAGYINDTTSVYKVDTVGDSASARKELYDKYNKDAAFLEFAVKGENTTINYLKRSISGNDIVVDFNLIWYDKGTSKQEDAHIVPTMKKYYTSYQLYINGDGYIYKNIEKSYLTDKTYKKLDHQRTYIFSDFNQKKTFDYDSYYKDVMSFKGKKIADVIKAWNLQ